MGGERGRLISKDSVAVPKRVWGDCWMSARTIINESGQASQCLIHTNSVTYGQDRLEAHLTWSFVFANGPSTKGYDTSIIIGKIKQTLCCLLKLHIDLLPMEYKMCPS
jgi:hypothetical protein